jgi:putative ABC transport system ATP-binding protein
VAIARAVVGEPPLILADEPTGNLDPAMAAEVMEVLWQLNRAGHTVLLITHDPTLAAAVPRRVFLNEGQLSREE